jgi:DNA-binding MurR/RpiR family transcriptional regulator
VDLIGHLGQVLPGAGTEHIFVIGTHRESFNEPHNSELGIEEVSRLRRFLKAAAAEEPAPTVADPSRMVVVIDHHAAHVFRDLRSSRPRDEVTIEPHDPHHYHHHLVHRKEAHIQGDRVPEQMSFYEEVAKALVSAKEIVLIGHGTGKSSAVDFLVDYLKQHRPEISAHVIATETADLSALTEPEIEAIAKQYMPAVALR